MLRAGYLGRDNAGMAMTWADNATFPVDQVTDATYQQAAPAISN